MDGCIHLWVQHNGRDAALHMGPSAAAETCLGTCLAVAGKTAVCFWPVPLLLRWLNALSPNFWTVNLSHPSTDHHKICTQVWCGFSAENLLSKNSPRHWKIWWEKIQIYLKWFRPQYEVCNFRMAQYIHRQITAISSTMNVLQNGIKLMAVSPQCFDETKGENW